MKWSLAIVLLSAFGLASANTHAAEAQDPLESRVQDLEQKLQRYGRKLNQFREQLLPVGTVVLTAHEGALPREMYVPCDGRLLDGADPGYATLYDAVGTTWGPKPDLSDLTEKEDKERTNKMEFPFRLPDLRGEFLRVFDAHRGVDKGRILGKWQDAATSLPTDNDYRLAPHPKKTLSTDDEEAEQITTRVNDPKTHGHGFTKVPNHDHSGDDFHRVLKEDGKGTAWKMDDFDHPGSSEPNLRHNEPIEPDGEHDHSFRKDGEHTHKVKIPGHNHEVTLPELKHEISGGDSETRARNQAVCAYIRYR